MEKTMVKVINVDIKDLVAYLEVNFIDKQFGDEVTVNKAVFIGDYSEEDKKYVKAEDEDKLRQDVIDYYGLEFEELEQLIGTEVGYYIDDEYNLRTSKPVNSIPLDLVGEELEGTVDEVVFLRDKIQVVLSTDEHERLGVNINFKADGVVRPKKRARQLNKFMKAIKATGVESHHDFDKLTGKDIRIEVEQFDGKDGSFAYGVVKKIA